MRLVVITAFILYAAIAPAQGVLTVSRSDYAKQLQGFWLAQSIANWTGLITEMCRVEPPFYTSADWGTRAEPSIWGQYREYAATIDFFLPDHTHVWGSDDDTDIEYMYQHLLYTHGVTRLSGRHIRDGWLKHIYSNEEAPLSATSMKRENYLWVSSENAFYLMKDKGLEPPATSEPENNPLYSMIDAQLTTEIFGLFAPGRPDAALKMAELPIRVSAKNESASIARFYVTIHALAAVDPGFTLPKRIQWMADEASKTLPENSYPADMYRFVLAEYQKNKAEGWEATRDAVYQRYQNEGAAGYNYIKPYDAGINFAASLVSLFHGQGDLVETLKIAVLAGWDSDNPAATWGGLLGFMYGIEGVKKAFDRQDLSQAYWIHRTRKNFPDHTPGQAGEDNFQLMAKRALVIIDRVVKNELNGQIKNGTWIIPREYNSGK